MSDMTEKQSKFLDAFLEAIDNGMHRKEAFPHAKQVAGYSPTTVLRDIVNDNMTTAILNYANQRLLLGIPTAIEKLESVMDDPTQDGAKITLDALGQWFDRGGVIKKESKEVIIKAPTGIVALPSKAELDAIISE